MGLTNHLTYWHPEHSLPDPTKLRFLIDFVLLRRRMLFYYKWTFVFEKFDGNWKVIQENGTHTIVE